MASKAVVTADLLTVGGLDFAYTGVPVLHDTELAVRQGEVLAVVGPNGGGKTTLLRLIAGLERPDGGSIQFDGQNITTVPTEQRVRLGIAVVFGGAAVFGDLSVEANLRAGGDLLLPDASRLADRIKDVFEVFPRLAERRNALGAELSGGEQQMLALGKAFVLEPKLLCIDELSLGLAPALVDRLLDVLRERKAGGTTILLVEQSVRVALAVADRAAYFERGRVCSIDDTDALLADPKRLHRMFFGDHAA
jgi:ABC-type branched-subunit amino acid transport system ATPase component